MRSARHEDKPLRSPQEKYAAAALAELFEKSSDPIETRLESFPKYVRRQNLTRFLALYEVFKRVLAVKGSIVECGVHRGFGLMSWAKLSSILEPVNLTRRIYGFDTFTGFPSVHEHDVSGQGGTAAKIGELAASTYEELLEIARVHDQDRYLGHIAKIELIRGDARHTIPEFIKSHEQLVVSLLFMDFDLFEPTSVALEHFVPRMPKGAVIAFDELDNPIWPGETMALLDKIGIRRLELQRLEFDPYIAFARMP